MKILHCLVWIPLLCKFNPTTPSQMARTLYPSTNCTLRFLWVPFSFLARRGEDCERTFGGKTIAAGLTIRVTPMENLAEPAEIDIPEEIEAQLVKDEVKGCAGLFPGVTPPSCFDE